MNLEIAAFAASINNLPGELTGNPSNYAGAGAFFTALNQRAGELQVSSTVVISKSNIYYSQSAQSVNNSYYLGTISASSIHQQRPSPSGSWPAGSNDRLPQEEMTLTEAFGRTKSVALTRITPTGSIKRQVFPQGAPLASDVENETFNKSVVVG